MSVLGIFFRGLYRQVLPQVYLGKLLVIVGALFLQTGGSSNRIKALKAIRPLY